MLFLHLVAQLGRLSPKRLDFSFLIFSITLEESWEYKIDVWQYNLQWPFRRFSHALMIFTYFTVFKILILPDETYETDSLHNFITYKISPHWRIGWRSYVTVLEKNVEIDCLNYPKSHFESQLIATRRPIKMCPIRCAQWEYSNHPPQLVSRNRTVCTIWFSVYNPKLFQEFL